MKSPLLFHLLTIGLALHLLVGCGSQSASSLPVLPGNPIPYLTRTPVFNPTPTLPATKTPEPTPTPSVYVILKGDTLSAIAQRLGVSLEALLAANPGLQPTQLTVGQIITLPVVGQKSDPEGLSTPVPADLDPVVCFPTVDGLTCLAPVHNSNAEALENVRVEVTLFGEDGQPIDSQPAFLPLNLLQPGQTLPALVDFDGIASVRPALSQLKTATLLMPGDQRYLRVYIQNLLTSLAWDGSFAQVTGQVGPPEGEPAVGLIWLVAVAYDSSGQIVGYRRWERKGTLPAGSSQPFTLVVYSYGPAIDQIEVFAEARP